MINLSSLRHDSSWSFADVKRRETLYATHGYHKYPAKFIPQLAKRLIEEYSNPGDTILDPFGGCGTTAVEALIENRESIGIDVNRVAVLISKTKTKPIDPELLQKNSESLLKRINETSYKRNFYKTANKRLKYWFKAKHFNKLRRIYNCIQREEDSRIRLFYNCCFSNILKNCSIWFLKSIKPQRDPIKNIKDPIAVFTSHLRFMIKKNTDFANILNESKSNARCRIIKGDARNLKLPNNFVDLIITSPPYVTSYEYADLHQLSTLWFGYADNISEIKKEFVGSLSRHIERKEIHSKVAKTTLNKLRTKSTRLAKNISNYYSDLHRCYSEMHRVTKPNKYLCLIMGNTEYRGIMIPNSEISVELLQHVGFKVNRVIKRKLSAKIFTPYRDGKGKFTNAITGCKKRIYQYEYIIIAQKIEAKKESA